MAEKPEAFEFYQRGQSPNNKSKLDGKFWASFIVDPQGETLLAGFYACQYKGRNDTERQRIHDEGFDPIGTCDVYELTLDSRFQDLAGKLIVDWGAGLKAWIQRADKQNKNIIVIRKNLSEPDFPGFARFIEPLSKIEGLYPSWITALRSSKGIYVLTCTKTKEQYVGSATGSDGFYGRWLEYAGNGHGGNIALKSREPSDYQIAILEVAGSAATSEEIIKMETIWKRKLQSREMGLNRNY